MVEKFSGFFFWYFLLPSNVRVVVVILLMVLFFAALISSMFVSKMKTFRIVFGILAVGIMQKVPREYFQKMLGPGDTFSGVVRAALAG